MKSGCKYFSQRQDAVDTVKELLENEQNPAQYVTFNEYKTEKEHYFVVTYVMENNL